MPLHPGHRPGQAVLVAPLRGEVEHVIGAIGHVEAARVGRVGVIDRAVVAAAEGAEAGRLLATEGTGAEAAISQPQRKAIRNIRGRLLAPRERDFNHMSVVSLASHPCFMIILSRKGEGCP